LPSTKAVTFFKYLGNQGDLERIKIHQKFYVNGCFSEVKLARVQYRFKCGSKIIVKVE